MLVLVAQVNFFDYFAHLKVNAMHIIISLCEGILAVVLDAHQQAD